MNDRTGYRGIKKAKSSFKQTFQLYRQIKKLISTRENLKLAKKLYFYHLSR